jgi:hypothetical protein
VAIAYRAWLDTFLVHETDRERAAEIEALGIAVVVTDILMPDRARETALARAVLGSRS